MSSLIGWSHTEYDPCKAQPNCLYILCCIIYFIFQLLECTVGKYHVNYTGTVSVTREGYPCQRWDSQQPNNHSMQIGMHFPDTDVTLSAARNFCRNPNLEPQGAWCFVASGETRWSYCDIPKCRAGQWCWGAARPSPRKAMKAFWCNDVVMRFSCLTLWGRDKMDAILQTQFSNALSWMRGFNSN